MEEVRKDIPWYEWYQASNTWLIRTIRINQWRSRTKVWVLTPYKWNNWYSIVKLQVNWYRKSITAHKLIMLAFVWIRWIWLFVNHIDWNKNNNILSNLEYVTQSENELHAYRLWLKKPNRNMLWRTWINNPNSKCIIQYDLMWNIIWKYWWEKEAHYATWIHNIRQACNGRYKTCGWFIRKYSK